MKNYVIFRFAMKKSRGSWFLRFNDKLIDFFRPSHQSGHKLKNTIRKLFLTTDNYDFQDGSAIDKKNDRWKINFDWTIFYVELKKKENTDRTSLQYAR